jgi:hypothetical protein
LVVGRNVFSTGHDPKIWEKTFGPKAQFGSVSRPNNIIVLDDFSSQKHSRSKSFPLPLSLKQLKLPTTEFRDCSISTVLHPLAFMASRPDATSEPGSPPSTSRSRGKGKGLTWSDIENLALCDGHQQVSERAEIGAGMRKAEFHRRLQARLRASSHRPVDACTLKEQVVRSTSVDERADHQSQSESSGTRSSQPAQRFIPSLSV